ncbi:MAG: molybdopterin-synthase adenylyltransferase MoeB [Myxococcales bacterium]|nr:molybdopterin-synthase adenylyltransferase MoeB [Myxococcales bacterium]
MTTGKNELLAAAREIVTHISPGVLSAHCGGADISLVVDVRESHEVEAGKLPGAVHIPRGRLELEIEGVISPQEPVVVYCHSGLRSLLAAKTLMDMGYQQVYSLEGGVEAWKAAGLSLERGPVLSDPARQRYARQLTLPEVGESGQLKLQQARVLVVGAGGLGSPSLLYLAGAGVGTLGIVDDDLVELSNLHRQVIHRTDDAGIKKVESVIRAVRELNPEVRVESLDAKVHEDNIDSLLSKGWDVVLDGTDRIPVRYLLNDKCTEAKIPLVYGAVHTFEGQVTVFAPHLTGPCYRCFFPTPPPPEAAPSCAEAGVLGVLPGLIGILQALQVLHILLGSGEPLIGRVLRFDGRGSRMDEIRLPKDPTCSTCGVESSKRMISSK